MQTMRRRDSLTGPPNVYQRHHSVATSGPTCHESHYAFDHSSVHNSSHHSPTSFSSSSVNFGNVEKSPYHSYNNKANNVSLWKLFPCFLLTIVPWVYCKVSQHTLYASKLEINVILEEQKKLVKLIDETSSRIREVQKETDVLERTNENNFQELRRAGGSVNFENDHYIQIEQVEEAMVKRIDLLEKEIQKNSFESVETKGVTHHLR